MVHPSDGVSTQSTPRETEEAVDSTILALLEVLEQHVATTQILKETRGICVLDPNLEGDINRRIDSMSRDELESIRVDRMHYMLDRITGSYSGPAGREDREHGFEGTHEVFENSWHVARAAAGKTAFKMDMRTRVALRAACKAWYAFSDAIIGASLPTSVSDRLSVQTDLIRSLLVDAAEQIQAKIIGDPESVMRDLADSGAHRQVVPWLEGFEKDLDTDAPALESWEVT